jgi:hypothetical protein
MADERIDELTLNTLLDEIASGRPVAEATGIAAELMETFNALRSLAQTPSPEPARQRIGRDVADVIDRQRDDFVRSPFPLNGFSAGADTGASSRVAGNRTTGSAPVARPVTATGGWRFGWIAIAALVLIGIALGSGYLLLGPGFGRSGQRNTVPAAAAPDPVTVETLLDLTLAPVDLPAGLGAAAGLTHLTVPAGNRSNWSGNCCPGLRIYYVLRGSLTVRPQGSMSVVRGQGSGGMQTVPVGTEVVIGRGDAFVSRNDVPFESSNPGSMSVDMLLIDLTTQQNAVPPGWDLHAFSGAFGVRMPSDSFVFRLRNVDLLPNAVLPAQPGAIAEMAVALYVTSAGDTNSYVVSPKNDGTIVNNTDKTLTVQVLTIEPVAGGAASPIPGGTPDAQIAAAVSVGTSGSSIASPVVGNPP